MVDSGAIISVFAESDCKRLGLELTRGTPFTIGGILGGSFETWIHTVDMQIGGHPFKGRVAFSQGKNHKAILGRLDVFGYFQVILRQKLLQSTLLKE